MSGASLPRAANILLVGPVEPTLTASDPGLGNRELATGPPSIFRRER